MKELIARILLPFLLLAQVGVGISPGRVLCIAVDCGGDCVTGAHGHAHPHAHGHDGEHRHAAGPDAPSLRPLLAVDEPQEGRLAGPGRAHEEDEVALRHVEGCVTHGEGLGAVHLGDVLETSRKI